MDSQNSVSEISLDQGWTVSQVNGDQCLAVDFPADIHSALLADGRISDPYWRDREVSLDWVHESEWLAEREFDLPAPADGRHTLVLDGVDCQAEVRVNGMPVGQLQNRFIRHDLDVSKAVVEGRNMISIRFLSNSAEAKRKADEFAFPVPHIFWNNRLPHYNFLRKPQCDAGWDWNIALSPLGIYGSVKLRRADPLRLDDAMIRQHHADGRVRLSVDLLVDAARPVETRASLSIDGQTVATDVTLWPGSGRVTLTAEIDNPRMWWPVGHGPQEMYDLDVRIGDEHRRLRIGLREIVLLSDPDEVGNRFAFRVNGREIFMRGANWIPADALPARATQAVVADLLDSAVEANMNMIRVWGGGSYEPDWFYQMCSERGLMVWQDFMFACNLYPAADRAWLDNVRHEARQQIRRLSAHPCLALWCGDNELVGALGWFDESKADRDRYLAMYDRLNHALEEAIEDEAPDVPWWPSSPSVGRLNFGDGWHDDASGDMHFWDVWHSAKDFEHYRSVRPRFCSEFGFQSFPSMRVIESFTLPEDRNVSSNVMDVHQRNPGGNSRIVETLARYFRFPDGFSDMVWLSQVSQAMAMKTAIEFWRMNKPRTMGTLYWQLNDTWPVASWAGLEYGGGWKVLHYAARRFYAPVLISAQPDHDTGEIVLWAVNDTAQPVPLSVSAQVVPFDGQPQKLGRWQIEVPTERALEIARFAPDALPSDALLHFDWSDGGAHHGENDYLAARPKEYALGNPQITAAHGTDSDGRETVTLTTDRPALWVTWDHGGDTVWSDNGMTLLPGQPRTLTAIRRRTGLLDDQIPGVMALKG
ncbi:glycoside hydrolase family 2 protein [Paracoccus aurantiacus]|uniref:beta-mannosidase n=1 Tax=Paracoccus aurantiacus TaxID=2599412 RepID=A0A5C6S581_9RHOB|nr:glycoside hydrolase family 2 protein [Paracoccus aurantiacus]TXB69579.1 glycoside hydrolase family 2 protein [Paracoccus aurantiacus]